MTVRIPAGVTDGQKLRLRGKGRPGANGGPAGDLVVSITIEKHPVFHMEGQNLHMKLPISYGEAALGAGVAVPMMDGSTVTVKIPAGTSSGTHLRLRKRGVKKGRKRGDLIIEIEIAVPKNLSADAKDAVKKSRKRLLIGIRAKAWRKRFESNQVGAGLRSAPTLTTRRWKSTCLIGRKRLT